MSLSMEQKQIHKHREQTCGCHGEVGSGRKYWEFGISRCKLLYIGWISSKVLLYGTGNYIQYPMISHNRKEYIKKYFCMCITVIFLYSRDWRNIVNQLYVNKKLN